jgi:hypothetical protein
MKSCSVTGSTPREREQDLAQEHRAPPPGACNRAIQHPFYGVTPIGAISPFQASSTLQYARHALTIVIVSIAYAMERRPAMPECRRSTVYVYSSSGTLGSDSGRFRRYFAQMISQGAWLTVFLTFAAPSLKHAQPIKKLANH